jgi:hypothetical protein
MFALTKASHPPIKVFFPVGTVFTVEEHGNYRKIRFNTSQRGAEGVKGVEITVGAEKQEVHTVDVTASLKNILRMKRDPTAVSVWWTGHWESEQRGIYSRRLNVHGTLKLLSVRVLDEDLESDFAPQDVQEAVAEHLRGADLSESPKNTRFDIIVKSGENRVTARVVIVTWS